MESLSAASMDDYPDILEFQELSNGPWPVCHLRTVIPDLLAEMCSDDLDAKILSKKATELVVLVIDKEGVRSLTSELLRGVGDSQARVRRSSAYLIGHFFKNSNLCLVDEAPNMISNLIILLSDSDSATVLVACEALSKVVYSVPKNVLPSFIKMVRDAVSVARNIERRKRKGGPVLIPGFCLPKAFQPILPIFLGGLASGSAELREQSALGLGELIEVTSEKMLKEFVIPITTGPLIRIIGDRFPWQVKSAILSTLTIVIREGGMALKPFLPQLQTTLVKCLQDNRRTVRSSAAHALGKLSALSSRIDPLVGDLLSSFQASSGEVRLAILSTLKGVAKHAGKSLSDVVRTRVYSFLKDLIDDEEDQMRGSAASILGIISQYFKGDQVSELLEELTRLASSSTWYTRHGSVLTISSVLRHNPSIVCASPLLSSVLDCLKLASKDEKLPVLETSLKALGRLLIHLSQSVSSGAEGLESKSADWKEQVERILLDFMIHTGTSVIGLGSNDEIVVVADGRCGVLSPTDSLKCNVAEEINSKLQLMQYGGICSGSGLEKSCRSLVDNFRTILVKKSKGKGDFKRDMIELYTKKLKRWKPSPEEMKKNNKNYPSTIAHFAFNNCNKVSFIEIYSPKVCPTEIECIKKGRFEELYMLKLGSGMKYLIEYEHLFHQENLSLEDIATLMICFACLLDPDSGGFLQTARIRRGGLPILDEVRPHFLSVVARNFKVFEEVLQNSFLLIQNDFLPSYFDEVVLSKIWKDHITGLHSVKVLCQCPRLKLVVRIFMFEDLSSYQTEFHEALIDVQTNILPKCYSELAFTQEYYNSKDCEEGIKPAFMVHATDVATISRLGQDMELSMKVILEELSKKKQPPIPSCA